MLDKLFEYIENDQPNNLLKVLNSDELNSDPNTKKIILNSRNQHGLTLLLVAVSRGYILSVQFLLLHGANPNLRAVDPMTRREVETARQVDEMCLAFLSHKCGIFDDMTAGNMSPLHIAAANGHDAVVEELIKRGAEVNALNSYGRTPLIVAARYCRISTLLKLLEYSVVIDHIDSTGRSAIFYVIEQHSFSGTDALLSKGAKFQYLIEGVPLVEHIVKWGYGDIFQLVTQKVQDINVDNPGLEPFLHIAAYYGYAHMVTLLIELGISTNQVNIKGNSALYIACQRGHSEAVKVLIGAENNINRTNVHGSTACFAACQNGHIAVVRMLLAAGADLFLPRKDGVYPIQIAVQQGYAELTEFILQAAPTEKIDLLRSLCFVMGKFSLDLALVLCAYNFRNFEVGIEIKSKFILYNHFFRKILRLMFFLHKGTLRKALSAHLCNLYASNNDLADVFLKKLLYVDDRYLMTDKRAKLILAVYHMKNNAALSAKYYPALNYYVGHSLYLQNDPFALVFLKRAQNYDDRAEKFVINIYQQLLGLTGLRCENIKEFISQHAELYLQICCLEQVFIYLLENDYEIKSSETIETHILAACPQAKENTQIYYRIGHYLYQGECFEEAKHFLEKASDYQDTKILLWRIEQRLHVSGRALSKSQYLLLSNNDDTTQPNEMDAKAHARAAACARSLTSQ